MNKDYWVLHNGDGGQYSVHLNEAEAIKILSHNPRLEIVHVREVLVPSVPSEDVEKRIADKSKSAWDDMAPTDLPYAQTIFINGAHFGVQLGVDECLRELVDRPASDPAIQLEHTLISGRLAAEVADWLEKRMREKGLIK